MPNLDELTRVDEYEINPYTMLIKPVEIDGKIYSHVFEVEDQYLVPCKPLEIIKRSCEYYGSNYEGRRNGAKQLIGEGHKIPIIIDPTNRIYFLPTVSPALDKCIWISLVHVKDKKRISAKETRVVFLNGQTVKLPIPRRSFVSQLERTAYLSVKLMMRIEENERKTFSMINKSYNIGVVENSYPYEKKKKK